MSDVGQAWLDVAEAPDCVGSSTTSSHRLVLTVTTLGTLIVWYDFFIYGAASALVFDKLFFPNFDPVLGKSAAFVRFAIGLFSRPLGAFIFGHYGDRIGRKSMLTLTILLMGFPTIAIGLMPTYDTLGHWAALLLVTLRFLQGIALGGEWGGAVLVAIEHAPNAKKSSFGALPQIGAPAGLLLSSLVFACATALPHETFLAWGWRLPFLLSVVLMVVGFVARNRLPESPEFEQAKQVGKRVALPGLSALKNHMFSVILAAGLKLPEVTIFYLISVFLLSYGTQLGLGQRSLLYALMGAAGVECIAIYITGFLADRIGDRFVAMVGGLLVAAIAFPVFWLVNAATPLFAFFAMAIGLAIGHAIIFSVEPSLASKLFPVEVRYSGISIAIQGAGALGGGLAPLVATGLLAWTGSTYLISLYLVVLGIVAFGSALLMRRYPCTKPRSARARSARSSTTRSSSQCA